LYEDKITPLRVRFITNNCQSNDDNDVKSSNEFINADKIWKKVKGQEVRL